MRVIRWLLCVFTASMALPALAQPQPSASSIRSAQLKADNRNRLVAEVKSAKGTPDEAITIRQVSAALANEAGVATPEGDFQALSLLRQLQTTGDMGGPTTRWQAIGSDGTQITCIVSPTNSQIIWQRLHAEMNPSPKRWRENCALSAPAIQQFIANSVTAAKRHLESEMRDPEGARYRNVHVMASLGGVVLCGEINIRNGFGGFNGYGRFIATDSAAELPDSGGGDSYEVVMNWPKFCTNFEVYRDMGLISFSGR